VRKHKIPTYRVFISHRYMRSGEYQRLVRMLDRAAGRDPMWRWQNLSIPLEAPVMTEEEARFAEVYVRRIRERMERVHVVLYILRDEWLESDGSIYLELVEATGTRYRPPLPIISVLPRGADLQSLRYGPPGVATVKWHPRSIIRAIREYAIPASAEELVLTPAECAERARIVDALEANAGHLAATAAALGISKSTLRRRRLAYLIR
jgi:hypothetical protein